MDIDPQLQMMRVCRACGKKYASIKGSLHQSRCSACRGVKKRATVRKQVVASTTKKGKGK